MLLQVSDAAEPPSGLWASPQECGDEGEALFSLLCGFPVLSAGKGRLEQGWKNHFLVLALATEAQGGRVT